MKRLVISVFFFMGTVGSIHAQNEYHFEMSADGYEDLKYGGVPVWRYMMKHDPDDLENTYKVYHHLFDFHGNGMITKGPGGTYSHHRGLFVGWNKTTVEGETYDFWHMKPEGTLQKHAGFVDEETESDRTHARRTMLVDWLLPDGKLVIVERRTLTASWQPEGRLLIDIDIKLESKAGEIKLDGDPQHAGFQFRASQEVFDNQKDTRYIVPEGSARDKDDIMKGNWAAALFKIEGNPYAVLYMAHPGNRHRDTAVFSTRQYARFGEFFATTLTEEKPLEMKYRLLVVDPRFGGEMTRERCQAIYDEYATRVEFKR